MKDSKIFVKDSKQNKFLLYIFAITGTDLKRYFTKSKQGREVVQFKLAMTMSQYQIEQVV